MTRVHFHQNVLHLCYISLYNHKLELNRLLYFWCLVWAANHDHTNKLYYNNIQVGEMKVARMDFRDIRSVFTMYYQSMQVSFQSHKHKVSSIRSQIRTEMFKGKTCANRFSQVLGLTFEYTSSQLRPEFWLKSLLNKAPELFLFLDRFLT